MPAESGDSATAPAQRAPRRRSQAVRRAARTRAENARLDAMWRYERELHSDGRLLIAGVDESGLGPLAGPVVAAAVILPPDFRLPGLWECKRLAPEKRPRFYAAIVERAIAVGIGVVGVEEIDQINIRQAGLKAMRLALADLDGQPEAVLVDGFAIPGLAVWQRALIDGDAKSISIAAASVIAKVTRDRIMERLDRLYPGYGFARHKGYGTREHYRAIGALGLCPAHRRSFCTAKRPAEAPAHDAEAEAGANMAAAGADMAAAGPAG